MQVIISENLKKLNHFLKKQTGTYYIYPGEKNKIVCQLLDKFNAREIIVDNYGASFNEEFVSSYLDLIGKLGLRYNSVCWWATFTSSKNRFVSRLLPNLFLFYSIIKILKENQGKDILIINPPHALISSIRKFCTAKSINLQILSSPADKTFD